MTSIGESNIWNKSSVMNKRKWPPRRKCISSAIDLSLSLLEFLTFIYLFICTFTPKVNLNLCQQRRKREYGGGVIVWTLFWLFM